VTNPANEATAAAKESAPSQTPTDGPAADPVSQLVTWLRQEVVEARAAGLRRPLVVGLVGLPGSGKSTLAAALCAALGDVRALTVSLDDFYLEAPARRARGFVHRGPPGTHDLALLDAFLTQLTGGAATLDVPQFDRDSELRQPAQPRTYPAAAPLDLCLIEGWFVGAAAPGYERLASALDRLIFLEMAEESARGARLGREASRRAAGHKVMSAETVAEFWAQALAPHFATWVKPLRSRADVVLCLDAEHRPTALQIGKPRCP
jgi:pantothenate kinase-related protein Tda10